MIANSAPTKAAVTVAEMARMVGLSRARFYQLMDAGVFPMPVYDVTTRRPFYVEESQKTCLEVRRRNCGINGRPVLFYTRRGGEQSPAKKRKTTAAPMPKKYPAIASAVAGLGLAVSDQQVADAVAELFPKGIESVDQTEVIRSVFVRLQRQDRS